MTGRTFVCTLKFSVSSESGAVPEGQPAMERRAPMIASGGTSIGSPLAPTTSSFPSIASPGMTELMVLASVTVARITTAPPSLVSSAAGSCAVLSM